MKKMIRTFVVRIFPAREVVEPDKVYNCVEIEQISAEDDARFTKNVLSRVFGLALLLCPGPNAGP